MFHRVISIKQPDGFIIIAVSLVMTALLFLAGYMVEQSISESRISKSETSATKAYYIAEAGVNEAIYLLKNDAAWKAGFLAGTLNNQSTARNNVFDANGSYSISATSISDALVDITVTGFHSIGDQQSQRVIKTRLARATNPASTWGQSFYAGGQGGQQNGNITTERDCTINGGAIHANQDFKVTSHSALTVNDAAVNSSNNIIVNSGSELILNNSTQSEGEPSIGMPLVDFDSASATSLKNRADQVYSANAFSALPTGTTLTGITFITGEAIWNNKNLTINGILAASDDIEIDLDEGKTVTINNDENVGGGLMSKDDIIVELDDANFLLQGVIYSSKQLTIETDDNINFAVTGGIISWHLLLQGEDSGACSITYDEVLVSTPIDPVYSGSESPIIDINHWEEQY
ncbi:MAG TPA: hypothetical protein DEA87_02125 [Candidatus Veblenbacteria bacterium]|uniref:Type 4 fimbrial biogenesis protein PilX N-terminal domain-containing protein n=3 Tax=Candidatus Vebleniibacteriota TaxID=1817921 RepID=A0A1G2Q7C5_9BACT|nr:MAG: hypothetical protein UV69_C0010G0011 [Parcubacteria group bacterium GW2011_GWE2_43_12]KKT14147.1 MAG: hypothetical protein UV92_C0005G0010 [Parcubacteria group bacterium GW2011_GWA1_43_27]KKT16896.1 MAG: hypothetical protein UW00_C0020G0005 [Parcubacteria group bacterium GW2011_GWB1_43_66]KKT28086.1 MAG: hypothetical protein UW12_C0008G0003 [Parcubacteria group bacterium GW2011_GWF1_43_9]OHA55594.1 MAG: hypothetical protein A2226_03530 [Candidatus Veblenbacteria bacterium RIFOXYA2_FULL_